MENNLKSIISNNIKVYMEARQITQTELADKMNVNQSTISLWINGERIPRMPKIDELCAVFDCPRSDFITRMQTTSSIRSSSQLMKLEIMINSLNSDGLKKVCEYISDLSDRYRIE